MSPHQDHLSYSFCPLCGEHLEQKVVKSTEPPRPVCSKCGYIVYFDPKIAVGTIIQNSQKEIALVRRSIEPGYGKWVFPGGYVDRGETLLVAAAREAQEEANLRIRIDGLINLYSYTGQTPIIVVYAATLIGGKLRADDESLEAAWFQELEIPWTELAFQSTHDGLRDHFKGVLHPYVV